MEFYNVKKSAKVVIADAKCEKIIYKRETANGIQERYAAKAVDSDGMKLTRFINKETFDKLTCKVAKAPAKKAAKAKK